MWWWTPEFAASSLSGDPLRARRAACVGVGVSRYRLKAALSVSPDGRLGYGVNLATLETQVPKFRRFRCLARVPDRGGQPPWVVVDLVPRGPYRHQISLFPAERPRTIAPP
jgi:hypothetical protein